MVPFRDYKKDLDKLITLCDHEIITLSDFRTGFLFDAIEEPADSVLIFMKLRVIRDSAISKLKAYRLSYKGCRGEVKRLWWSAMALMDCNKKVEVQTYRRKGDLSQFLEDNPQCAKVEDYETVRYNLCKKYNIDLQLEKVSSECDFGMTMRKVDKNLCVDFSIVLKKSEALCKFLPELRKHQTFCEMGKITVTRKGCKVEHNLLMQRHPECTMTFESYLTAKKVCNLPSDFILKAYDCGLSATYNFDKRDMSLCDGSGNEIIVNNNSYNSLIFVNG